MNTLELQEQLNSASSVLQQIHNGQTHVGIYLCNIFKFFPVGIAWGYPSSDQIDTILGGCNQFGANIMGLSHPDDSVEKSNFEVWDKAGLREDLAIDDLKEDRYLINNNCPKFNTVVPFVYDKKDDFLILQTKIPFYDIQTNTISILGIWTNITGLRQSEYVNLKKIHHDCFDDVLQAFRGNKKNYYIAKDDQIIRLTERQAACLTYLAMGKNIKQIASLLEISSRTVESHINFLKHKLNVYSIASLIDCFWHNPIKWF